MTAEAIDTICQRSLPRRSDYAGIRHSWRADALAGITVGVVALPLALAFGVTSGVGAAAGLVTAIVAGLVAAVFGGSNLQVSGPTGAMTVVLVPIVVLVMLVLPRVRRSLPASIIAIAVTTLVAWRLGWDVDVIGPIPSGLAAPQLPALDTETTSALFSAAIAVAALAAIESLLSARVADGMTDTGRLNPDRDLFGQGLASVASGVSGGMPATGAIARTAVNARAGARTRVAAIIPLAALAGVLMVTAIRMVDRRSAMSILRSTKSDAVVMVLTALATVVFDFILAVEIGIAVAAVLALRAMAKSSTVGPEDDGVLDEVGGSAAGLEPSAHDESGLMREHIAVCRMDGALFFGAEQYFLDGLTSISDMRVVILRLGGIRVIDASGGHALEEIITSLQPRDIAVMLCGVGDRPLRVLEAVGAISAMRAEPHVFSSLPVAIEHVQLHVRRHLPSSG